MKTNNLKGTLILLIAAIIWGLAFVAQSGAADLVPPFATNSLRSFIAAIVLYILYLILNRKEKTPFIPMDKSERKSVLLAGLITGFFFFMAANFQQFGIKFYPANAEIEARSAFITALYVILVPIFAIFIGKKISPFVLGAVGIAVVGVYLLCFSKGIGGIYFADLLVFICAICFALHIMCIDKYVGPVGGVRLSVMQFVVCAVISLVCSLIFETELISFENIISAAPQIVYLGIMSSSVAYTLQIIGQKYAEPSVASITMSLESVFGAVGGWLISGKTMTGLQIIGCVIMFAATVVAQIPEFSRRGN